MAVVELLGRSPRSSSPHYSVPVAVLCNTQERRDPAPYPQSKVTQSLCRARPLQDGRIAYSKAAYYPERLPGSSGPHGRLPLTFNSSFGQTLAGFSPGPILVTLECSALRPMVSAQVLHEAPQASCGIAPLSGHTSGQPSEQPGAVLPIRFSADGAGSADSHYITEAGLHGDFRKIAPRFISEPDLREPRDKCGAPRAWTSLCKTSAPLSELPEVVDHVSHDCPSTGKAGGTAKFHVASSSRGSSASSGTPVSADPIPKLGLFLRPHIR